MEWLFTPWRMRYIQDPKRRSGKGCIFCEALARRDDRKTHVVHRGARAFVILNLFPYTAGHLLIAPNRHVASLADLDAGESADLVGLLQRGERALGRAFRPQGFNVGANLGPVSGAGIPGHLHFHLVPRWRGDSNFMPVVGETRIIPQSLSQTWRTLRRAWDPERASGRAPRARRRARSGAARRSRPRA